MARPRKERSNLRTVTVRFRVTHAEYIRIQRAAATAATTVSTHARRMVLLRPSAAGGADPPAAPVSPAPHPADSALLAEIRHIGVNINQAVKRFHATDKLPAELPRLAMTVDRLLKKLLSRMYDDGPEGRR